MNIERYTRFGKALKSWIEDDNATLELKEAVDDYIEMRSDIQRNL